MGLIVPLSATTQEVNMGKRVNGKPVQNDYPAVAQKQNPSFNLCHWCGHHVNIIMSATATNNYCSVECYNAEN